MTNLQKVFTVFHDDGSEPHWDEFGTYDEAAEYRDLLHRFGSISAIILEDHNDG